MNFVISVINANGLSILNNICERLEIPLVLSLIGKGTASQKIRDLWGIESNEKRIVITVADENKTALLISEHKRRLYIDAPGNGILIAVPVKSVGGGGTFDFLSGGKREMKTPEFNFDYELIIAIANEGHTDAVMDAAREAGAGGGTVIHAKGTGAANAEKFFKVSIAQEKEIILIVAKKEIKTAIMKTVIEKAGPATDAGAIVFSLPVSDVEGFRKEDNDTESSDEIKEKEQS
ncbi:MAG: P-II family nitrogen regulator [Eubacteriales bacterium]|nr:P-II family nitrogen regulator [Christensenellaceae bacterium]MDD7246229.1 P-II family nitrogen regulator [Christensenellaceae bacterium]MDY2751886.1 P-II family nitrogen regulator [Eubacteriales bacterium]